MHIERHFLKKANFKSLKEQLVHARWKITALVMYIVHTPNIIHFTIDSLHNEVK